MFTEIQIVNGAKGAALASSTEAIGILAPVFLRLPQAVAHWMVMHLQRYRQLCAELEQEPDLALIGPINDVLEELQQGGDATDDH